MADNFNLRVFLTENKLTKNAQLLNEANFSDSYDTPAAKAVNAKANQIVGTIRGYSTALQTIQDAIKQVEQEVGSEVTRSEKSTLERHLMHMFRSSMEMEREGVENDEPVMEEEVPENPEDYTKQPGYIHEKLTAKERRLVEMVNSAMGIGEEEGHQNADPNVPNDSTDMAIDMMKNGLPEGEEMVQDKPLPKYESIEELMKEIEHGTNEAAHKYKMDEMKRVYEALEAKVGSLEEGEHAEHIDQKAVKQMRKDIAALRKAEEKLRKEFDKKFSGKEKKETPAKEKATEALQEGFDLRKFLAENKLTVGSRMLNEKLSYDDFEQMIKPFLDLAKSKGWVWNSSGNSWYDMSSPAIALFHKDVVPTTKDGEYKGQPTELGTNPVAGRSMNVRGPLETKSADVIMSPEYNIEQAYFSAKDKTILDSIKGAMANNTDVIQDIKQTSSEFTSGGDFEPQNYYVMLLRKKGA